MRLSQQPQAAAMINIEQAARSEAAAEMQVAAEQFEETFHVRFDALTYLDYPTLTALHREDPALDSAVVLAADVNAERSLLTKVANKVALTKAERLQYFAALVSIYQKLPRTPVGELENRDVLFLGIEREGRMLAEKLQWLPPHHSGSLHAKRVPLNSGLLIGTAPIDPSPRTAFRDAVIIDGAIASGATIIAVLKKHAFKTVQVYSAHASNQGVRALFRYAQQEGIDITVTVGFMTDGLNRLFYAVDRGLKVVGDLGDTICADGPQH